MSDTLVRSDIVSPMCIKGDLTTTLTWPWLVQDSEYHPHPTGLQVLVNGEQTFAAVHEAIARAKRNVSIICWGFQPSMYFVRNGSHQVAYTINGKREVFPVQIGKLLEHKAKQGVQVRVLCFAFELIDPRPGRSPINVTGVSLGVDESNTPGRWDIRIQDRPAYEVDDVPRGDPDKRGQYDYDYDWYHRYDDNQSVENEVLKGTRKVFGDPASKNLQFYSRGFSMAERDRIRNMPHADKGLDPGVAKTTLPGGPSHHQKTVLVDYDDSKAAIAFVMGHNMLDEYWDTDAHHAQPTKPWLGRNGSVGPREDFSSRLSGPIVGDIFLNFAAAWEKETKETLPPADFAHYPYWFTQGGSDPLRQSLGSMVQIVRTQPQSTPMRQDIKAAYLQAVNNTTSYIFIENQYFRWPPLAEKIKQAARAQQQQGRIPSIYLFVITNSTDAGVGKGTINTYRMLEALGRRDTLPGISTALEMEDQNARLGQAKQAMDMARMVINNDAVYRTPNNPLQAQAKAKLEQATAAYQQAEARYQQLEQKAKDIANKKDVTIPTVDIPGLKTHICSLVAPDSKPGQWQETYIHAKLMLVNDTFTTLGSANINTRSMEVDSEMNILTENGEVATALRKKLWGMHTNNMSGANPERMDKFEMAKGAFNAWQKIIDANKKAEQNKQHPVAALRGLLRRSAERTNDD